MKFSKEHEWVQFTDNNTVKIGITDFAQKALGDIVYVEFPEIGHTLQKGSSFGVVESIKSVSDLYAPLTGVVKSINSEISDQWEKINEDPYANWLIELDIQADSNQSQDHLMDEAAYEKHCQH